MQLACVKFYLGSKEGFKCKALEFPSGFSCQEGRPFIPHWSHGGSLSYLNIKPHITIVSKLTNFWEEEATDGLVDPLRVHLKAS